jgi:hypothetical protein
VSSLFEQNDIIIISCVIFFLGIKICGGCSRDGREVNGIFIKRILPGGLADQDGKMETQKLFVIFTLQDFLFKNIENGCC